MRCGSYFAETFAGTSVAGERLFDVAIEGAAVLNDYDIFADVGANRGVMKSIVVTIDSNLDIDFFRVKENPTIRAIEILRLPTSALRVKSSSVDMDSNDDVDGADFLQWQRSYASVAGGGKPAELLQNWKGAVGTSMPAASESK